MLSGGDCDDDEIDVAYASNLNDDCTILKNGMHYCCKTRVAPFNDCHWVGKGDCADNTCEDDEITLRTHDQGDSFWGCNWKRKKALCCTPNLDLFTPTNCDDNLCLIDPSLRCGQDPYEDDFSDEDQCDPDDCFPDGDERRDLAAISASDPALVTDLVRRGEKRTFEAAFQVGSIAYIVYAFSRRYPGSTHVHDSTRGPPASRDVFR